MSEAASTLSAPRSVPLRARERLARALRWAAIGFTVFFFIPYYLTCLYILIDPPVSSLMARQALLGRGVHYQWRDLGHISPALVTQVIASEDGRFCRHWGVDLGALDAAADAFATGRKRGGGSTIDMQTAKNLFLWTKPAWLRKPFEIPLAYYMDFVLGKRRVLEIYLNIAEWAPGIYGAEAAARHHFHKSASELTAQEAAQLAAALPNPGRRNAGPVRTYLRWRRGSRRARRRNARALGACLGASTSRAGIVTIEETRSPRLAHRLQWVKTYPFVPVCHDTQDEAAKLDFFGGRRAAPEAAAIMGVRRILWLQTALFALLRAFAAAMARGYGAG